MDERTGLPALGVVGLRDRDVMNLLDQLELYALKAGGGKVTQRDYWLFVYNIMKSGELATRSMGKHLHEKLRGLGVNPP